ncbi:TniQ family protein [Nocardia sp. NPDC004750]
MSAPPRWPLHPQPDLLESLSSWLERLARIYRMPVKTLLASLGPEMPAHMVDNDWWEVPEPLVKALAERTGVEPALLRTMTLGGWAGSLLDKYAGRESDAQEVFDTYVRENSVLLRPGEAGRNHVNDRHWRGTWLPGPQFRLRHCPVCYTDPDRPRALAWRLPLVSGCAEHRCLLINATETWKPAPARTQTPATGPGSRPTGEPGPVHLSRA